MALDRKLRDGLDRATGHLDPSIDRRLAVTLRHGRRSLRMRRIAVATSAVVIVGVLMTVGPNVLEGMRSTERPGAPGSPIAPLILDGVWQSDVVTRADEAAVLVQAGYDKAAVNFFMRDLGALRTNIFSITFEGTRFTTSVQTDEGGTASIDLGSYTIDGNLLIFTYPSGGRTTFFARITDDRLSLALVNDSQPDYRHRPTEIAVLAIYTVASFSWRS